MSRRRTIQSRGGPSIVDDNNHLADGMIEALSSLLEFVGAIPSDENDDPGVDVDPWSRLSNSLKELMISLGKLQKLMDTGGIEEIGDKRTTFNTTNEILLNIEDTIHHVRRNAESVSEFLAKGVGIQMKMCRNLESIGRSKSGMNFTRQFLPMGKSLAGAIRRQKILWFQSLNVTEKAFDRIYETSDRFTDLIDDLQLVYKRVNRRCVDLTVSPWKEAVELLECIASDEIARDRRPSSEESCQSAIIIDSPIGKQSSKAAIFRSSTTSGCASSQLQTIVNEFLGVTSENGDNHGEALTILVVGPEGSGKTYLLNELEKQYRVSGADVDFVHPVLPFDTIGATAGAAEDFLVSLVCYAKTQKRNCIVLLDDIESICGQTEESTTVNGDTSGGQREPHLTARLRSLFLSLLDVVQKRNNGFQCGRMVLICSSRGNFGKEIHRFEKILPLLPPNDEERRHIVSNYARTDASIDDLVDCTLGFSRAELAHHCQQALIQLNSRQEIESHNKTFQDYLKEKLQSSTPESLKNGVNAEFVDMNVFSARDLQQMYPIKNVKNPVADLPLFGEGAKAAWQELARLIVLPVCQGNALDNMLYHRGNSSGKKVFGGGVLLAASPGTGKSTLAYYCAAVASSIKPSIKLIDVSCTSLIHKEVGGSERALHRLFESARAATPCIVVMDGIENIAAVRGNDNTTEGTMDRLLSTLLTELDGVESEISSDRNVGCMAIIGITHNQEWIDPALRRPGRLERTIRLNNPDVEGRKRIIVKELEGAVYKPDDFHPELQTLDDLATRVALETDGYTGAEVIAICNESKLVAFNNFFNDKSGAKKDYITPQLVLEAAKTQRANS